MKIRRFVLSTVIAAFMLALTVLPFGIQTAPIVETNAQDNLICSIFPFIADIDLTSGLCGADEAGDSINTIAAWARFGLSLIFIGIIIIAVVSIIRAAIEYIRSEGDEGKVEEASKSIKAVFVGIGALIVGLVGLAIVLTVIGADNALTQENAPDEDVQNFIDTLTGN